jgi:hypothetical protein
MGSDPQHAPYRLSYLANAIRRQSYPRQGIIDTLFVPLVGVLFEQLAHDRFGEFGVALEWSTRRDVRRTYGLSESRSSAEGSDAGSNITMPWYRTDCRVSPSSVGALLA